MFPVVAVLSFVLLESTSWWVLLSASPPWFFHQSPPLLSPSLFLLWWSSSPFWPLPPVVVEFWAPFAVAVLEAPLPAAALLLSETLPPLASDEIVTLVS